MLKVATIKISKMQQRLNAKLERKRAIANRIWEVLKTEFLQESYKSLGLVKIDDIVWRFQGEYSSSEIEEGLAFLRYRPGTINLRTTKLLCAEKLGISRYACGMSSPIYGFVVFESQVSGGLYG